MLKNLRRNGYRHHHVPLYRTPSSRIRETGTRTGTESEIESERMKLEACKSSVYEFEWLAVEQGGGHLL